MISKFNKYIDYKILSILSSFLLIFGSCKSKKIASTNGQLTSKSVNELIQAHKDATFSFNKLQSKLKINYDDSDKQYQANVSLRMQHNQKIWMSVKVLGITMAKALITPKEVRFYEKLNKRYYIGNFDSLSEFLGVAVNFEQLQNIILGQYFYDEAAKKYTSKKIGREIILHRKKKLYNSNVEFGFYADWLKLSKIHIDNPQGALLVDYKDYQEINKQMLPEYIDIRSRIQEQNKHVSIKINTPEINSKLRFPFSIPKGYTPIKL